MNRRQRAAARMWFGSGVLARRLAGRAADWVRKGPTRTHRVVRIVLVLLGLYVAARIVRAAPNLMWAITAVWCWCAARAARPSKDDTADPPADEVEEGTAPDPAAVRTLLADLMGAHAGVHLSTVLAHLQQQGQGEGWTVTDLRARLEAAGVPVRRCVKVARRVAYGVHRDDLSAPSPRPAEERAA
ncbi:hypothetical protein AB0P45_31980 [Streptomyces niveus]|uniref:hypothetical protein n=1 Tax=Streptomyces niveus TaxID=193462 RepID=UPI0034191DC2